MINDRVRKPKHRRGRSPQGRLAAWREASSRVASPPPQLEWPSFARDGNCEALGPTADYDGTLQASQRGALERETFFRFATSRRTFCPQATYAPNRSRAHPSPPRTNVPCSRGRARRGAVTVSRVRAPGLRATRLTPKATSAKKRSRALSHTAGGARWPAFAPRMHRASQLRVRVSRRFAPSVAERSTLPRPRFPCRLIPIRVLRRSLLVPSPRCSRLPRFGRASGTTFATVSRLSSDRCRFAVAFNVLSVMPTRSKRVDGSRSLVRRSLS